MNRRFLSLVIHVGQIAYISRARILTVAVEGPEYTEKVSTGPTPREVITEADEKRSEAKALRARAPSFMTALQQQPVLVYNFALLHYMFSAYHHQQRVSESSANRIGSR